MPLAFLRLRVLQRITRPRYLNLGIYQNLSERLIIAREMQDPSPLSSLEVTPEPAAFVIQEHPAAFESNLEEVPTIVRPPAKPKRSRSRRKKSLEPVDDSVGDESTPSPSPKKKRRKTAPAKVAATEIETPATKRSSSRRRKAALPPKNENQTKDGFEEPISLPQRQKRAKPRKRITVDGSTPIKTDGDYVPEGKEDSKPRRRRKLDIVEPGVYDIPPVEQKSTIFKGRLGYACLNTILRNTKPDPVFCSRTCRIETIKKNGLQFVKDLGMQNARDLIKLIEWNEANKIRFFRVSSELFPFASHEKYGFDLSFADEVLKEAGNLAKRLGHRLTTHPGQFTQLGSPTKKVVENSIRELEYHNEMLDRMGLDQDSVMIIHMGGVYGDKPAALERFKKNYIERLSDRVKRRLVLENDELCYNLDDLLPISLELNIPVVLDYHHDWIYPSSRPVSELIPIINEVWRKKGIRVKQHLSEPRPGAVTVIQKRAHADRCHSLPEALPDDVDLMIEAKDKEQAVFHLYRIYGLEDVSHENLRPEKPIEEQTLETGGRKSNKRARQCKLKEDEEST